MKRMFKNIFCQLCLSLIGFAPSADAVPLSRLMVGEPEYPNESDYI